MIIFRFNDNPNIVWHISRKLFPDDSAAHELPPLRPEVHEFVASLLENVEVPVIGASRGPVGKVIHALFAAAQKVAVTVSSLNSINLLCNKTKY